MKDIFLIIFKVKITTFSFCNINAIINIGVKNVVLKNMNEMTKVYFFHCTDFHINCYDTVKI